MIRPDRGPGAADKQVYSPYCLQDSALAAQNTAGCCRQGVVDRQALQ